MRYDFKITPSDETNRLKIVFDDMDFANGISMSRVSHVGGRRDENGTQTHWVFPPATEVALRAYVAAAIYKDVHSDEVALAEQSKFEATQKAAKASKADARKAELAEITIEVGETTLLLPYAAGAAALLRAAGAVWMVSKFWQFPASRRNAIVSLVPKLKACVLKQLKKDDKGRYDGWSDGDFTGLSDDGVTSRMGMTANEVRRELRAQGRR